VAEACTLCAHRLDVGQKPACVEACEKTGARALSVGDLNDPDSEVSKLIANTAVKRIREDLGTKPKVFYIGL
jgi:Fe-S-cluster-containing dehydrogenase component